MGRFAYSVLGSLLLFFSTFQAQQQHPTAPPKEAAVTVAPPSANAPTAVHSLDAPDLEAFFDGIIPLQLERSDVAGASVLVMKDGKLLLQKGYGFTNAKDKKPVDPATSIFRLASISKLFTWVSVMQLQEQGKLDLDADVNTYLDFKIRDAFGKPITLYDSGSYAASVYRSITDELLERAATPAVVPPVVAKSGAAGGS